MHRSFFNIFRTFFIISKISFEALKEKYAIFRGSAEEVAALGKRAVAAYIPGGFGMSALVYRDEAPAGTALERAGIEDIMLYFSRGERL